MKLFNLLAAAALTFTAAPALAETYTNTSTITTNGETCTYVTTIRGLGTRNQASNTVQTCEPEFNAADLSGMMGGNFTY